MGLDYATITAFVSAIAAVVAIILSVGQMRLSNKQSLFERRISIWLTTLGLINLYENNRSLLKKDDAPQLSLDLLFVWRTNNTFLCDIGPAASHPLEQKYQQPFLMRLEDLGRLSLEARLAFKGHSSEVISRFLADYRQLLFSIYQYQVLLDDVKKNAGRFHLTLEEACSEVNEADLRHNLYDTYDAISKSFDSLNTPKMFKAIEKQIRLV